MPVDVTRRPDSYLETALRGIDQAEEYVTGIGFKTGPPRLLGIELEWTVHHLDDPTRPLDPGHLARALHPHTPSTLDPQADPPPLPGGNVLTVEPGGQVEISSQPHACLAMLHAEVGADVRYLTGLLARAGLALGERGTDPYRPPRRLLRTPRSGRCCWPCSPTPTGAPGGPPGGRPAGCGPGSGWTRPAPRRYPPVTTRRATGPATRCGPRCCACAAPAGPGAARGRPASPTGSAARSARHRRGPTWTTT